MKKLKRAFTLAELLLCIGIIGIVSAMGMVITKHSTDKAYQLYYYTGYINLYNAIADAKANGKETVPDIMNHVQTLLSRENSVANSLDGIQVASDSHHFDFLSYSASTLDQRSTGLWVDPNDGVPESDLEKPGINPNKQWRGQSGGTGGSSNTGDKTSSKTESYPDESTLCKVTSHATGECEKKLPWPKDKPSKDEGSTGGGGQDGSTGGGGQDGSTGGGGQDGSTGGGEDPNPTNDYDVTTSNGIVYTYSLPVQDADKLPGVFIRMSIPAAKTRTNNGFDSVIFYFSNDDVGYLVPISNDGQNLQIRRDLLPVYIDDGKVGRNNIVNRENGFQYEKAIYGSYKDAYCSLGLTNLKINDQILISCEAGSYTDIRPVENGVRKSGILKIANPQKAH